MPKLVGNSRRSMVFAPERFDGDLADLYLKLSNLIFPSLVVVLAAVFFGPALRVSVVR